MKPENKAFLEDNRRHWHTLRDAKYLRHLDGNTRSRMMQVMAEEFQPGYTADLWCPPCVSEMITTLYRWFEEWEAAQLPVPEPSLLDPEYPDPNNLQHDRNNPTAPPTLVKANFPSHRSLNAKAAPYKGFTLIADRYLQGSKFYWEIQQGDKIVACTLWNDDKIWNSPDAAIKAARSSLDKWLSGKEDIYFNPTTRV